MHNELKAKKAACDEENEGLKAANLQLSTQQAELQSMVDELKARVAALEADTAIAGVALRSAEGFRTRR
jgi:peptidoglycan hydrolase CwlO-like protein